MRTPLLVVVDADCLIAGVLTRSGATTEVLDLWSEGALELVVCPNLIDEVSRALRSPRIARYGIGDAEIDGLVGQLAREGVMFEDPVDPPREVPGDPNDDYLIALAIESGADCLVTRDKHLDDVRVKKVRIITPGRLLREVR